MKHFHRPGTFPAPSPTTLPETTCPTGEKDTDTRILEELIRCAGTGWRPEDLRHELGSGIGIFFDRVLDHLRCHADPEILGHWIRGNEPVTGPPLAEDHRTSLLHRLELLDELRDWRLLSTVRPPGSSHTPTQSQLRACQRVQALLRKAESTPFPDESLVFTEKAVSLRRHHRIDTTPEHDSSPRDSSHRERMVAYRIHLHSPWIRPQFRLLAGIARAYACESHLLTSSGISSVTGDISDVAGVRDLFAELSRQRDQLLAIAPGAAHARANRQSAAYRRRFLLAYARRIEVRLTQIPPGEEPARSIPDEHPGHRDGRNAADRSVLTTTAPVLPCPGQSSVEQVEHRQSA